MTRSHRIFVALTLVTLFMTLPRFVHEHPGVSRHAEMQRRVAAAEERETVLRRENLAKLYRLEAATGDAAAIEFRARSELLFVRPDEKVLIFAKAQP
jgi:cell division protein FtsB